VTPRETHKARCQCWTVTLSVDIYRLGGKTQPKTILLSKTNLSPAQKRLENAADAVNRMQEAKDLQKSAADNSCLGVISPEAASGPGTS
jgi:hypothetical protein